MAPSIPASVYPRGAGRRRDRPRRRKAFLAAVTAGYEVGIALSAPLTELTTPPFRATAVFGPVAAAAAVGRIRGLGVEPMRSALSSRPRWPAGPRNRSAPAPSGISRPGRPRRPA